MEGGHLWHRAMDTGHSSMPGNQGEQFGPRHHQVHFVKKLALALALCLALEPTLAQAYVLYACNVSHPAGHAEVLQTFLRQIDFIYLASAPIYLPIIFCIP
jgi:hypothetical protein